MSFSAFQLDFRTPAGFDRTRNVEIGNKNFGLTHLEEAYTTEHWLVRIYKVLDLENRVRSRSARRKPARKYLSKKVRVLSLISKSLKCIYMRWHYLAWVL